MSANARPEPHDWDRAKTQILASNTAQGVYKHLRDPRGRPLARPPAMDLGAPPECAGCLGRKPQPQVASVEVRDDELTFHHNGRGFQPDEITHLIYYGSTKLRRRDDALGRFGSGFLTTHLLSLTIEVSGQLTNGQSFAFELDRSGESVDDLQRNMDASFEAFKSSLAPAGDRRRSGNNHHVSVSDRSPRFQGRTAGCAGAWSLPDPT